MCFLFERKCVWKWSTTGTRQWQRSFLQSSSFSSFATHPRLSSTFMRWKSISISHVSFLSLWIQEGLFLCILKHFGVAQWITKATFICHNVSGEGFYIFFSVTLNSLQSMANMEWAVLGVVWALSSPSEFNNRCDCWPGKFGQYPSYMIWNCSLKTRRREKSEHAKVFSSPSFRRRRWWKQAGTQGWQCWSTSATSSSPSTRPSTSLSMLSRFHVLNKNSSSRIRSAILKASFSLYSIVIFNGHFGVCTEAVWSSGR